MPPTSTSRVHTSPVASVPASVTFRLAGAGVSTSEPWAGVSEVALAKAVVVLTITTISPRAIARKSLVPLIWLANPAAMKTSWFSWIAIAASIESPVTCCATSTASAFATIEMLSPEAVAV